MVGGIAIQRRKPSTKNGVDLVIPSEEMSTCAEEEGGQWLAGGRQKRCRCREGAAGFLVKDSRADIQRARGSVYDSGVIDTQSPMPHKRLKELASANR